MKHIVFIISVLFLLIYLAASIAAIAGKALAQGNHQAHAYFQAPPLAFKRSAHPLQASPVSQVSSAPDDCGPDWSIVQSPNPSQYEQFFAVAAVSANDVWAVGTSIEHWDGSTWQVVPDPDLGPLWGVAAISSTDVWAVGNGAIEHWDGQTWSTTPHPGVTSPIAIAAISSTDVWAMGDHTAHWDGSTWSVVPSPNRGPFNGVAAISSNDVWAVGDGGGCSCIAHWDGSTWSVVPSPDFDTLGGEPYLYSVAAVSSTDVWAAGSVHGNVFRTLIEHWDGSTWSAVPSPNRNTTANELRGVSTVSSTDVWAVGYNNASSIYYTLAEHYNTCQGSPSPTGTPIATATATSTPTGGVPPSATPTVTPIPTSTPETQLVGHVTWQGPPTPPSTRQQLPVTLTLQSGTTEVGYGVQNTDTRGYFTVSLATLPSGTYRWRVKGPRYLANCGSVDLNGAPTVPIEMGLMKTGDADDNNIVSTADFTVLRDGFGGTRDLRGDFNNDGVVSTNDFTLLRGNFGQVGCSP